jgi:dipeptidyl aminopeptidase/acylaminoacyl peptidase
MSPGWRWAAAAIAVAAGLVAADRALKSRFGRPRRRRTDPPALPPSAAEVRLPTRDGAKLHGWWLPASQRLGPAALVIHGWGGCAVDMAPLGDTLHGLGLHVLLIDARGHGQSDEVQVASMPGFADDVRAGLAWLRGMPVVDTSRIVLVGHSVGAGACLFVAAEDANVAAVVSLASMADPRVFMAQHLRRFLPGPLTRLALRYVEQAIGHRFVEFVPVSTINRVRAPVLLLHGRQDTTVPVADAYRLHALSPNTTLRVVDGADHASIDALDPALLADFLEEAGLVDTRVPHRR